MATTMTQRYRLSNCRWLGITTNTWWSSPCSCSFLCVLGAAAGAGGR
ncbi:unnamed protein product, partial [Musa banksii]